MKNKALTTLVKFVQDLGLPLGLRLQHLHADRGGEFTADCNRNCSNTTAIIRQFSLPNSPEQKWPQRTGRAYSYGPGPVHAQRSCATEVSSGENGGHRGLFTQLPAKQDHRWRYALQYYRMFGKHVDLSLLQTIGARGCVQNEAHLRKLNLRAREGVLIGYDDDKSIQRIYFR